MAKHLPLLRPTTSDALFRAASESFTAQWAPPRTAAKAVEAGHQLGQWFDEAMAMSEPPASPYACRDGCAYCCHLKVILSPPEAVALIDYLRHHLSKEELAALRASVIETDRKSHGLSASARARERIPCPLLRENRCIAYEARPIACRGANSYDASACERAFNSGSNEQIPHDEAGNGYGDALRGAAASTAHQASLDPRMLELVAALRIGLEQSETAYDWIRGKKIFAHAVDEEFAANLARMQGR